MKKKFDFTAEMKEAQATKSTPQNEYLEEEKRLLGINVKELAELNDNVYGLRTDLTTLVDLLEKYKLSITQDTQEQAIKFGNTVLGQFIDQIEIKCTEAEQRIAQMDNRISLSHKAFYILIVHSNSPILFLGLYDRGECRIFAFLVNLENGCCMWAYCDLGNYDGGSGDVFFTKVKY